MPGGKTNLNPAAVASPPQPSGPAVGQKATVTGKKRLTFQHVATGTIVSFDAKLKNFTDNFSSNWNSETVYGRMDPIMTFQNTQRDMSIEFLAAKDSGDEAAIIKTPTGTGTADNEKKTSEIQAVQFLATLLYPTYGDDNSLSIKDPPLLRINFPTLIESEESAGLLVAVQSITYDRGKLYTPQNAVGGTRETITANFINATITFTPLHEFDLGWQKVAKKDLDSADQSFISGSPGDADEVWRFGGKSGEDKIFQNGVIIKDYTKK